MDPRFLPGKRLVRGAWMNNCAFTLLMLSCVGRVSVPCNFHVERHPSHAAMEPRPPLIKP